MYRIYICAVVTMLLLPAIAAADATGIVVTGSGEVKAQPDIAYVTLGVNTQSGDAAKAAKDNAGITNAVIAAVMKAGIAKDDIETADYSVNPIMDYKKSPPMTVGYNVSNRVRLTIRDMTQVGSIIDIGVKAGANNVQGIDFSIEDDTTLCRQALSNAVAQAKSKANSMAEAAGVKLGRLISMSEAGGYTPRPMLAGLAKSEAAPTPVIPGELTVTASVTMVYAIL
ncbi:SIMPL domain-containing protein [bacterium]|nr:SIMPL domain-containing protein [bacterium]